MSDKEFISGDRLVRDSFMLARQIYDSGYEPDVLVVLWRGGTPVGMVVHEFLLYKGIDTYHTAVKAASYEGIEQRSDPVVEHMDSVLLRVPEHANVLVIDDIFDSGCTVRKVVDLLAVRTSNVRIATLYYKPDNNQTDLRPDFFLRETDRWIVFPHELMDLTPEEISEKGDYLAELVHPS